MTGFRPTRTTGGVPIFVRIDIETIHRLCSKDLGASARELFILLTTLPYSDSSAGWGGSVKQLATRFFDLYGLKRGRGLIARDLRALEAAGVVWTERRGRGLAVGIVGAGGVGHERPVPDQDTTRERGGCPGSGHVLDQDRVKNDLSRTRTPLEKEGGCPGSGQGRERPVLGQDRGCPGSGHSGVPGQDTTREILSEKQSQTNSSSSSGSSCTDRTGETAAAAAAADSLTQRVRELHPTVTPKQVHDLVAEAGADEVGRQAGWWRLRDPQELAWARNPWCAFLNACRTQWPEPRRVHEEQERQERSTIIGSGMSLAEFLAGNPQYREKINGCAAPMLAGAFGELVQRLPGEPEPMADHEIDAARRRAKGGE